MGNEFIHEKYGSFRAIEHQMLFKNNPDLLDFLAVHMMDLFVVSDRPTDQARANKCREVLQTRRLLDYPEVRTDTPTFESVKEVCRKSVSKDEKERT